MLMLRRIALEEDEQRWQAGTVLATWVVEQVVAMSTAQSLFTATNGHFPGEPGLRSCSLHYKGCIHQWHLSFFGNLCRANIGQDHSRALRACIRGPPKSQRLATKNWKTEADLAENG